MKQNLVLIHLESLNNILYRMNPSFFPTIRKIEKGSVFFSYFFSTATSTLMVLADIFYGGMEQYEQCTSLDYIPKNYVYSSSLFDDLKNQGYHAGLFIYPDGGDRESAEKRHIAGFQNEMILKKEYDEYLESIKILVEKEPFAIAACNYISNLALNRYVDLSKADMASGTEKWRLGYERLDRCVGDIFQLLEEKNVLDNTTVIMYGDHGDDYWGHGMHSGLTHAIEPYGGLIHTPFLIYDRRLSAGERKDLISALDIRKLIEVLLQQKNEVSLKLFDRKLVMARNSYAAQPLRNDSFKKSYSVTDGRWLMLVSNDGLEMYDIEMDSACINNFLNFFFWDGETLQYDIRYHEQNRFHYRDFMNDSQKRFLRQKFYYLRAQLYSQVKVLYEAAGLTEEKMTEEMEFNKIHYTGFGTIKK